MIHVSFHIDLVTKDMTSDFLYYAQNTPGTIWTSRIYQTKVNIPSKPVCSAMCTLSYDTCKFYVYDDNTLTCYFGQQSSLAAPIVAPMAGLQTANVRPGYKGEYHRSAG